MKTLAIDGSSKSTGIAIFEQNKLIHYECITASYTERYKRIDKMVKRIRQLYDQYKPTNIVMQQVLPQDVKHNQKVYKTLIYLQGAIVLELQKNGAVVNLAAAAHWRAMTGIKTGRGVRRQTLKAASQKLIKDTYDIDVNDDIADSICIGLAYIKQNRSAF